MDYNKSRFYGRLASKLNDLQFKDPSATDDYQKIEHLFKPGMSKKEIKEVLKANKLHKHCELVPYIDHKLNGAPLLGLTQRDQERVLEQARQCQYVPGVPPCYVLYRIALVLHNDALASMVKPPPNREQVYKKYEDMFSALAASRL